MKNRTNFPFFEHEAKQEKKKLFHPNPNSEFDYSARPDFSSSQFKKGKAKKGTFYAKEKHVSCQLYYIQI